MRRMCLKAAMCAAVVGFAGFGSSMSAQGAPPLGGGVVDDWSHHRLIFSSPEALPEDVKKQITNEPRYQMQQRKRSSSLAKPVVDADVVGAGAVGSAEITTEKSITNFTKPTKPTNGIKLDWTENLIADGQVQPNAYPAKFSFSTTTSNCISDYVVYPTGVAGATGAATIVGYNELYGTTTTGCAHNPVPAVEWAYNTGTSFMVTTSPIISYDSTGSQIAFVQSNGTTAELTLLKWTTSGGTLAAPVTPNTASSAANYRSGSGCALPCMYSVSLGANDTYSSPYYDYADDAVYVGDDSGRLHKITGVFNGTPTTDASPWPVTLNGSYKTTSPIYDSTSGYVFVGNTDAILYSVGSGNSGTTNGTIHSTSGTLGGAGAAIIDAPLVDSSAGKVYAFVSNDTGGSNGVFQFATNFASGTTGTEEKVGTGATEYWIYDGTFDNVYYSSTGGTAGDLWVMGNTGSTGGGNLYRIPIGAGSAMGTPVAAISTLTHSTGTDYPWPSPITEYCNQTSVSTPCGASGGATTGGTDYLFFSVNRYTLTPTGNKCSDTSGDGCILVYSINTPTNTPTFVGNAAVTTVARPGCWSTGGIIIDNSVPAGTGTGELTGASEIYTLELNGNGAGGPIHGTYTSSTCTAADTATPIALQGAQSNP